MEPRPPRPHQPGEPTHWSDEPSPGATGGGAGSYTPPGGSGSGSGTGRYLPPPPYPYGSSESGPQPEPPRLNDRRRMILGSIFAVVALLIVAALVLFAIDRGRNDNNNKATQSAMLTATRSSELFAAASAAAVLTRAAVPTATATPAATPTPTQAPATPTPPQTLPTVPVALPATPSPTATPKPAQAQHAAHIADMLPADSDVPKGLVVIGNGTRTIDEVAQSFTDPTTATANLQQWGWLGNVYKQYGVPDNVTPDPNLTTFIDVSIHRFGNAADAEQALAYFAGDVMTSQGLHQISVPAIGDHDEGLAGAPNQANLVVIYIQRDSILYRIAGSSPSGDPTSDVVAVARKVVAK